MRILEVRMCYRHVLQAYHMRILEVRTRASQSATGWQKCIGCLTLQVFFRKRTTNYRAFLRKMTGRAPSGQAVRGQILPGHVPQTPNRSQPTLPVCVCLVGVWEGWLGSVRVG